MDFWSILLIIAALTGVLGWSSSVFINIVYWYCEWQDGNDINWGADVAWTVAVPFAYLFAVFEIGMLYCR